MAVVGVASLSGDGDAGGGGNSAQAGGPNSDLSASDTVRAYLDALSNGDATKALSFGSAQPSTTALLTDDILRKQNAKMPISNIRILDEDKALVGLGQTTVHVAVNFGDVVDDAKIDLKRDASRVWKLEAAAIKIDPPYGSDKGSAAATVTLFGKDFAKGSLYAFPGFFDVGSSNEYLAVTGQPVLLEGLTTYMSTTLDPEITFTDEGNQAVMKQLVAAFANCQGSHQLAPPNCPTEVGFSDAVDGTVNWGPADLSQIKIGDLSSFNLTVLIGGKAKIPLSYKTASGDTQQGIADAYVGGTADVSKAPPALNFD